jgi:HAMP domain-containing protein/MFS family permease
MTAAPLTQMSADIEQQLKRRATLVVAVLVAVAVLGMAVWLALSTVAIRAGLEPHAHAKARVLADTIGDQIERAVGLGIPLNRLVGVDDYFDDILAADAEIAYLSLRDSDGTVLMWRGRDGHKADASKSVLDALQPVEMNGQSIGMLQTGITEDFVTRHYFSAFGPVGLGLLVGLAMAAHMVSVVMLLRLLRPLKVITTIMRDLAEGRFEKEIESGGAREISRLATAINRTVARINDQWEDLRHEAEDTRGAQIDKGIIANIDRVVARLRVRYRFAYGGVTARRRIVDALHLGLPLLLLVLVHAQLVAQPEQNHIAGLFAFGALSCIALGVSMGFVDRVGRRRAMLVAALLMAAGDVVIALSVWADSSFSPIGWAIAGTGMGMALSSSLGESDRRREATESEWPLFSGLVATGTGLGLAAGTLISPILPTTLPPLIAVGAALLAAGLIWTNLDDARRRDPSQRSTMPDPTTALRAPDARWPVLWAGLGMGLSGAGLVLTLPHLAASGDLVVAYAGLLLGFTGWLAAQPLARYLDRIESVAAGSLIAALLQALAAALLWVVPGQLADLAAALALGLSLSLWSAATRAALRRADDSAQLPHGLAAEAAWLVSLVGWVGGFVLTLLPTFAEAGLLCLALAALVFALRPRAPLSSSDEASS